MANNVKEQEDFPIHFFVTQITGTDLSGFTYDTSFQFPSLDPWFDYKRS